ncbi:helix-turn-helix transcriptional regulator [Streptomyces sp. bgisy159]|uniref:helix-turn-helix transcriptional regulator n=1 Tax=Streptomyces sp. bgisy159 TaxID=3413795 RepID=UPI003F4A5345
MTGDTTVRVVTGEPGCGRTRYLHEAARSFTAGPVVHLTADPARPAVPYGDLRILLRALGHLIGRAPAEVGSLDSARTALFQALRAAAARAPVLVCADDADLWDPQSRAALGETARLLQAAAEGCPAAGVVPPGRAGAGGAPTMPVGVPGAGGGCAVVPRGVVGVGGGGTGGPRGTPVTACGPLSGSRGARTAGPRAEGGSWGVPTAGQGAGGGSWGVPTAGHCAEGGLRGVPTAGCGAEGVRLLVAVAGHVAVGPEFAGLPVLRLDPLAPVDAAALLDAVTEGAVDPAVRDVLVDEAEGNPGLLLALARSLSPAQLLGHRPLPHPVTDTGLSAGPADGRLGDLPRAQRDVLLTVAAAVRASADGGAAVGVVLRALAGLAGDYTVPGLDPPPGPLTLVDGRLRFRSGLLRRAVYAGADGGRRRAVHRALAGEEHGLAALLHRSWSRTVPEPETAARLVEAATDPAGPAPHRLRYAALARAAELAENDSDRARYGLAAAEQALLAGRPGRALRLLATAPVTTGPTAVHGLAHLLRGTALLHDGPVGEAHAALLLAAGLLHPHAPDRAHAAALAAVDAAWAAGDTTGCLRALGATGADGATPGAGEGGRGAVGGRRPLPDPPGRGYGAVPGGRSPCGAAGERTPRAGLSPDEPSGDPPRAATGEARHGAATGARATSGPGTALGGSRPDATGGAAPGAAGARGEDAGGEGEPGGGARCEAAGDAGAGRARGAAGVPSSGVGEALTHHRLGLRALLEHRFGAAVESLRRVVEAGGTGGDPEGALRGAAAALLMGDLAAARHNAADALVAARAHGTVHAVAPALEYLAYAELRAGRHAVARTHAEEGLRAAHRAGQRNIAAHHHAVLALAASIDGDREALGRHVSAALRIALSHGLTQTATLTEWAAARADLGAGRPSEAADRLAPLVRPGPRRGHFAVWMLAVPCAVEAAVRAGRRDGLAALVDEFALWARFGADPQAPAQLLRCRALLAPPDRADLLYRRALDLHERAGGDFERARTELLHGQWLRRRRRLREAREHLGAALVGFERCGARAWAEQARAELRANGVSAGGAGAGDLTALTPQQLRIVRHVARGATNREVAQALTVSTRTVDYHLRKVFAALGVRSRVELARLVELTEQAGRAGPSEKTAAHP